MEWAQVLTVIIANFGIWLWARSEASADRRDTQSILREMKNEMKDFHYRLLQIEKNRK